MFQGTGLGLRHDLFSELKTMQPKEVDFLECAPENWLQKGGRHEENFSYFSEHYPIICHGLSLSLGGVAPLDEPFLHDVKEFFAKYHISVYSEHLSYCGDRGHLYELFPIPFTEEAIKHVAGRIQRTQDILQRRIAVENISYYVMPQHEMSEVEFINAVLAEADCDLLLDVNNVFVNANNHGYNAKTFLRSLRPNGLLYIHVAGHIHEKIPAVSIDNNADENEVIVDTHGSQVEHPVWQLLSLAYELFGVKPTLLERDFNIPPLTELIAELQFIKQLQQQASAKKERGA